MSVRRTGLQTRVLGMYRKCLKLVLNKQVETRPEWYRFVVHHFRGTNLTKRDVNAIEFQLRKIQRLLDTYSNSSVQHVTPPPDASHYPLGWVAKSSKSASRQ